MCEARGVKTILRPQEFFRAGTARPGFEIPGSATGYKTVVLPVETDHSFIMNNYHHLQIKRSAPSL